MWTFEELCAEAVREARAARDPVYACLYRSVAPKITGLTTWSVTRAEGAVVSILVNCPQEYLDEPGELIRRVEAELILALSESGEQVQSFSVGVNMPI